MDYKKVKDLQRHYPSSGGKGTVGPGPGPELIYFIVLSYFSPKKTVK
jgi:hypothetical protein